MAFFTVLDDVGFETDIALIRSSVKRSSIITFR